MNDNLIFMGLHFVIGKCESSVVVQHCTERPTYIRLHLVYANSFLATYAFLHPSAVVDLIDCLAYDRLHARQKLRNRRSESTGGDGPLPVTFLGDRSGAPTGNYGQRVTPGVS